MFECCQAEASRDSRKKARMEPEQGKKVRDTRRMPRFKCNGVLYTTLRDGYFDCTVKHHLNHVRYKDIRIPEKWRQFITDNYKRGPTMVCVLAALNQQLLNRLSRFGVRFSSKLVAERISLLLRNQSATIGHVKVLNSGSVPTTRLNQHASGAKSLVHRRISRWWKWPLCLVLKPLHSL